MVQIYSKTNILHAGGAYWRVYNWVANDDGDFIASTEGGRYIPDGVDYETEVAAVKAMKALN